MSGVICTTATVVESDPPKTAIATVQNFVIDLELFGFVKQLDLCIYNTLPSFETVFGSYVCMYLS